MRSAIRSVAGSTWSLQPRADKKSRRIALELERLDRIVRSLLDYARPGDPSFRGSLADRARCTSSSGPKRVRQRARGDDDASAPNHGPRAPPGADLVTCCSSGGRDAGRRSSFIGPALGLRAGQSLRNAPAIRLRRSRARPSGGPHASRFAPGAVRCCLATRDPAHAVRDVKRFSSRSTHEETGRDRSGPRHRADPCTKWRSLWVGWRPGGGAACQDVLSHRVPEEESSRRR